MKRKSIFFVVSVALLIGAGINFQLNMTEKINYSDLTLENIEAFSVEGEQGGFDCMMETQKCSFKPTVYAHLSILKKLGFFESQIGATVDISSATQIYYKKSFYWPTDKRVRCGKDVTCNDLVSKIMGW